MTTSDTAAVRAWARENGYEVADRGRLRPEVVDAYAAAHRKPAAAAKKKAPAKKAAAPEVAAQEPRSPGPKPSPVGDDRRLVALGEEIAALTARVAQLEAQGNGRSGKSSSSSKAPRFRRSK